MEQLTPQQWALIVVSFLLFVSETLPFTEKVKANGIFQGAVNVLKFLKEKVFGKV